MARGSVIKRGDAWRICVELPPDPISGERRQKWETVHGLKKDAEKRLTELLALADQGRLGADPKMTVGQFQERWLADYASGKSPKTFLWYQQLMRDRVCPHIGGVKLDKLTPIHIARLQTTLREADRLDGKPGKLSVNTVRHVHRVLHAALAQAVKWELIPRNPADGVDAPSVPRKEMRTFSLEQAHRFMGCAAGQGVKWEAFFYVFLTGGLRTGELIGLRWEDVSIEAGAVSIRQNIQRVAGIGLVVKGPKSAAGRRSVALGSDVMALLRKHRAEQNVTRLQMGPLWEDNDLVFPNEMGNPLSEKTIHNVFTRICRAADVPRIRPYDLRHCCATFLLAAGVHPKVVAERLGHSNINLTLTTYSHVLPTMQKDAAETLDRLLRKVP